MEQDCDGLSILAFDTTRRRRGVERKFYICLIFFAVASHKFLFFTANGATFFFAPIA
jgi:hypothetical protein